MDGWMDGRPDGRTDGRTDGQTDGRTDGRTDGWMDGWHVHILKTILCSNKFDFAHQRKEQNNKVSLESFCLNGHSLMHIQTFQKA